MHATFTKTQKKGKNWVKIGVKLGKNWVKIRFFCLLYGYFWQVFTYF